MRKSVMLSLGAMVVIIASAASQPARADAKDEFKKGCTSGGGSYGEDVNGVFCNSSGGVHIACDDKITKCTASSGVGVKPISPKLSNLRAIMNGKTLGSSGGAGHKLNAASPNLMQNNQLLSNRGTGGVAGSHLKGGATQRLNTNSTLMKQ